MDTFKTQKITWVNFPLLLGSVILLACAWFVPVGRDPSGQGNILLSMILMVRALVLPPSPRVTAIGCSLVAITLAGNAGLIANSRLRLPSIVLVVVLTIALLLWDRLFPTSGSVTQNKSR
jgi:hypothetical protein